MTWARAFNLTLIKRSVNLSPGSPGSVYSCVKHARKHRVDFVTDPCRKFGRPPADTRLTGISVFFGVTSCSCGDPDGQQVRLCRCNATANPLVYFGTIHFDDSISRDTAIPLYIHGEYIGLYICHFRRRRLAGSTRNGNPVIYRKPGMSFADDTTFPSDHS